MPPPTPEPKVLSVEEKKEAEASEIEARLRQLFPGYANQKDEPHIQNLLFNFSPFSYIEKLRKGELESLDPKQMI